ncbi:MAG: TonB-dependent receptor, partial [Burkholderiaceae bacterium]|nr:TonB-dependent receptor [Burkholderiaceae bacterium]
MAETLPEPVQQVWVTGTRLPAPGAEAPVPLLVVSSNDIAASGAANVQDLLQKLPALGLPGFSRSNSNFLPNGAGVATLNLRNLGEARTLVLVNGRRFVSGVPGNSAVDLNTLPTALIDRIEVMTGGASAAYGSDAVAGVVNLILKTGGAGWRYDVSAGRAGAGDDDTRRVTLGWGATGPNGALNVLAAYTRQGAVYSRDRDYAANDQISKMVASGQAADAFIPVRNYSVAAPQGRFFFSRGPDGRPGEYTYDRAGNINPWSTNGSATLAATGFNRADYRTIALPIERLLLAANGEQSLAPGHRAWFEANLARAKIRTITEPLALSSADVYRPSNGQVPADTLVNGVAQRNPLVPQYLYDRISDTNGDGLRDYSFSRRLAEAGTRSAAIDRNMHRLAVGLAGEPGGWLAGWRYDSYAVIGRATESQLTSGQVSVANFRNALAAIPAVGGGAMCADATARAQGCVPLNLFGYGTLSPEALAYILAPMGLETRVTHKLLGATISGAPWTLPAGPLGLAAGFEWRSESSDSIPDALTQAGGNSGGTIPRTRGAFTVREAYLEARIPLIKGAPLLHDAAFLGAWRAGNYSTVGRTTSWNGGLEWRPVPDVRLRATRALSTRAPNINELYAPPTQVSPTGISDPCQGVTATSSGTYDNACRAAPGVAANIAANGKFTLSQA